MAQNSQVNKSARSTRKSRKNAAPEMATLRHAEIADVGTVSDEVVLEQPPVIENDAESDAIDNLLAELDAPAVTAGAAIEVNVETAAPSEPVVEATAEDIASALIGAEAIEVSLEAATAHTDDGSAPSAEVVTESTAAGEPAATEGEAKPKRTATPRKHYTDKTERLKDRVGAGLAGFTVLTVADAVTDPEEITKRMEETMAIIKGMNKKEQNRATGFIEFLAGKKASLNEVLHRTLKVLERDGYVKMGKDGNLLKDLIARPYSPAAARAMGGNTVGMFADLKVLKKDGDKFVANPESTLLVAVMGKLAGATVAPAAEETPAAA